MRARPRYDGLFDGERRGTLHVRPHAGGRRVLLGVQPLRPARQPDHDRDPRPRARRAVSLRASWFETRALLIWGQASASMRCTAESRLGGDEESGPETWSIGRRIMARAAHWSSADQRQPGLPFVIIRRYDGMCAFMR